MIVHRIVDEALGNTSYLMETGDGRAVAVDPRRDADEHLALAAARDLRIVAVLETHLHADFVSGAREIAATTAAEIVAASPARLHVPHRAVTPGERLAFADVSVEVLATPGHTPEHLAYVATAGTQRVIFSGGSLIVGGAARTDLNGPGRTDELARAQFATLQAIASLPDDTILYPTHGGGSFCSSGSTRSAESTIGNERATNGLLGIETEDRFVRALREAAGSYPRYFAHLCRVNREGAPLLTSLPVIDELSAEQAQRALIGGAWLIDIRPVHDWARAHATGSVSIELRPAFASWLGWVVPFGDPFMLMGEPEQMSEAVRLARRIGYDTIEGWIPFTTWDEAGLSVSSVEELPPGDAAERARSGAQILDVRQANEVAEGRIAGATHRELGDIIAGATPDANEVITYCGHGERSATAASLLERRGITVANLRGGFSAWLASGRPIER